MHRVAAALVALALLATACGGGDEGDQEAYCAFITTNGVGTDTSLSAEDLDQLLQVAPPDIRDAVQELLNTTREFVEIEEIDELFDAAFDPDAQAAREEFNTYASDVCGFDGEAISQQATSASATLLSSVRRYVRDNFGSSDWTDKVAYQIEEATDGQILDITVTFIVEADGDEPSEACTALGIWLYEVRNSGGSVEVIDDDEVVVHRLSREDSCVEPSA